MPFVASKPNDLADERRGFRGPNLVPLGSRDLLPTPSQLRSLLGCFG